MYIYVYIYIYNIYIYIYIYILCIYNINDFKRKLDFCIFLYIFHHLVCFEKEGR